MKNKLIYNQEETERGKENRKKHWKYKKHGRNKHSILVTFVHMLKFCAFALN